MLTFAYGSNMDWGQMKRRCPSALFVCRAVLRGHLLWFPRKNRDGHGVAGVKPSKGEEVWGVVYQIDELDVGKLNKSEGYRPGRDASENSYMPQEHHVYEENDEEKPVCAWVYMAHPEKDPPDPNAEYKRSILTGAKFWNLPADYISKLEKIPPI